eukprot:CAMPEP_0114528800 /NCGR_PEP_ID=MMETSP0109-20121206/24443_1 /TAXON_ID=29199 /ORGANISM="Chlorarachnion reptans, Strain CCCM449" /LENGTH=718 /DNA_ID=CAMNT_0001711057 /DNA_START=156 /DNA_END=2313 /DNA_ORIENTATION=-
MADWNRNSRIASTIAKARASLGKNDGSPIKASLLDPSRPFTPMVSRDSRLFTGDDESKRDWPVFYTEGTLSRSEAKRKQNKTQKKEPALEHACRPSSSKRSSRPSSSKPGSRPSSKQTARSQKKFAELFGLFSNGVKELKEKKTNSSVTPGDLCELALDLLSKAKRGPESLQTCQAIFKLPIKYSGREDSRYHKVMYKCLKRQFEHSVRQDYDELMRRFTLIPLGIKQLKKILKAPQLAPVQHISYILGAFRNLSEKEENQRLMVRCDAIPVLASMLHEENLKAMRLPEMQSKIKLIREVTTILRNLAVVRSHSQDFVQHAVVSLLGDYHEHVVFGVCRILSKLTFFPGCRTQLSQSAAHLQAIYRIMENHRGSIALGIRSCFIMGNLTVSNDGNRLAIVSDFETQDPLILRSLQDIVYQDRKISEKSKEKEAQDIEVSKQSQDHQLAVEIENFLTKIVRLLANICINEKIGSKLCTDPRIGLLVELLERKDQTTNEELVLNVISAITNLSFYRVPESVLPTLSEKLLGCLMPLLFSTNHEMLHEAVRVLGNYSRSQEFRRLMKSCRVDEAMSVLMDHSDEDVIFATTGVLLNISTDHEARQVLYTNGCEGLNKVVECLFRFGQSNPAIAVIVCKILINLSVQGKDKVDSKMKEDIVSLGINWIPPEVQKKAELWCEEWLEDDKNQTAQANSPVMTELNDVCIHILEIFDKKEIEKSS